MPLNADIIPLILVGVILAIVLPITLTDWHPDAATSENWTQLGDPWGGNERARAYRGVPAPPQQLFPLHEDGVTTFTMEHRCPGICVTDFSRTCTDERQVSNEIFDQPAGVTIPDPRGLSTFAWGLGQLVDHDITKVAQGPGEFCSISLADLGPEVSPISIKRTIVSIGSDGCRNPRSSITPYIDGTPFYGDYVNPVRAGTLREYTLGRLKLTKDGWPTRDPANPREFLAGDVRASEHAVLSALHTLFARQHNNVAALLHDTVQSWSDEQLYWKARRIVVAQYQRIIYEEWLPALMGDYWGQTAFGMHGVAGACAPEERTGTTLMKTEFAQAAFRFGHTMVADNLGSLQLKDLFFNADLTEQLGLERIFLDSIATPSQRVDAKVVDTLRNFLFNTHGMDLVTLNIARDREIGVADYDDVLACYGDATPAVSRKRVGPQVDLFVRLLQEPLYPGSSLPETIAKIVATQFIDLCRADRFFYTRTQTLRDIGRRFYPMVETATLKGVIVNNTALSATSLPDNVFFMAA